MSLLCSDYQAPSQEASSSVQPKVVEMEGKAEFEGGV